MIHVITDILHYVCTQFNLISFIRQSDIACLKISIRNEKMKTLTQMTFNERVAWKTILYYTAEHRSTSWTSLLRQPTARCSEFNTRLNIMIHVNEQILRCHRATSSSSATLATATGFCWLLFLSAVFKDNEQQLAHTICVYRSSRLFHYRRTMAYKYHDIQV